MYPVFDDAMYQPLLPDMFVPQSFIRAPDLGWSFASGHRSEDKGREGEFEPFNEEVSQTVTNVSIFTPTNEFKWLSETHLSTELTGPNSTILSIFLVEIFQQIAQNLLEDLHVHYATDQVVSETSI